MGQRLVYYDYKSRFSGIWWLLSARTKAQSTFCWSIQGECILPTPLSPSVIEHTALFLSIQAVVSMYVHGCVCNSEYMCAMDNLGIHLPLAPCLRQHFLFAAVCARLAVHWAAGDSRVSASYLVIGVLGLQMYACSQNTHAHNIKWKEWDEMEKQLKKTPDVNLWPPPSHVYKKMKVLITRFL